MAILYKIISGIALVLFAAQIGTAQEQVSKTIEERFPLSNTGALELENKYGNIIVTGWDKDEVSVKIAIMVNRRKEDDAKDLLGRINPKIKSSSDFISITTEVAKKNTGWFADFFNRTNPIDTDKNKIQIDYEVFLPKKAKLKVTNRFGDLFIEDWSGELKTLIEHGDLWVSENLNKADIILKFGKVRTKNLNYASLNLKNGELDMGDAKNLRINGSGTDMQLGNITTLEIYSNKDDIFLDGVETLYGNLKFSSLRLERLSQSADLKLKIADFNVMRIISSEAEINLEQESSEINLIITDFSHRFTAKLEQGVVRLPQSFENVNSNMLDKGKKLRKIQATYGKSKEGSITITGIKGIVTLRE